MSRNRCQPDAPSIMPASPSSVPTFCSAATNSSMKVPLVVKTAMRMKTLIATDGPAIHSHQLMPRNSLEVRNSGPAWTPTAPRATCTIPRGSLNQFGPVMPIHESTSLTTPDVENRNSHSTVIATELVTDGK